MDSTHPSIAGAHALLAALNTVLAGMSAADRAALLPGLENLYRSYVPDAAPDALLDPLMTLTGGAVITFDAGWRVTGWNLAAERMYGWSAAEALGRTPAEVLAPVHVEDLNLAEIDNRLLSGEILRIETIHQRRDGTPFWVESSVRAQVHAGQITGYMTFQRDIQDRKLSELTPRQGAEKALETNRLLAVIDAMPVGICLLDDQGGMVLANHGYTDVWGSGYQPTRSVKDHGAYLAWNAATGEPLAPEDWASARAVQRKERVIGQMLQIQRFDGQRAYVINSAAPILDPDGNVMGCAVVIIDVTDRVTTDHLLIDTQNRAELQRRLLDQREQDRLAYARDIHDGPVQTLSSALFNVQLARMSADPEQTVLLDAIADSVKTTLEELRMLITDLRPPSAIRFGLARALVEHAATYREKHPQQVVELALDTDAENLSETVLVTLYRVFAEALYNVDRHARATRVQVRLCESGEQLVLEIQDDGTGFAFDGNLIGLTEQGHFGLAGMFERVQSVGGSLEVSSAPGQGTMIRASAHRGAPAAQAA